MRGFITSVMLEAKEIGARIGLPIADTPQDRHQVTLKLGSFKTSMLQDVEAGKPVELDALVGAVREMGVLCGVATPSTDALLGWPGCEPGSWVCIRHENPVPLRDKAWMLRSALT